ncbi:hypothetical protein Ciccas_013174 [Cichlidogyrus casuarinus]|uniref:EB domain-containing protein n=1 Tax=Cichlidogyrus casuarinus TaxID=1844966 RepID=A0ABD2PL99_9PLAT
MLRRHFTYCLLFICYFAGSLDATHDPHYVLVGGCSHEPDHFCSVKVENSICNKVKNECFCKRGFVAIREGSSSNSVACKTLLTDLTCSVDSNCIHVNGSSCHPGAGFCSCPSGTIYVPLLHACRELIKSNEIKIATSAVCSISSNSKSV